MRYVFMRYPDGKSKAVTFSYDDGVVQDKRLAELFDKYGMKGTFNFNTGASARRSLPRRRSTRYFSPRVTRSLCTARSIEQTAVCALLKEYATYSTAGSRLRRCVTPSSEVWLTPIRELL